METFKVIMLPLAVVLLAIAVVLPPGRPERDYRMVRFVLAGIAAILAAIALFIQADAVS